MPGGAEHRDLLYADNGDVAIEQMCRICKKHLTVWQRQTHYVMCLLWDQTEDAVDILHCSVGSQHDEVALDALVSLEHHIMSSIMQKQQAKITQFFSVK